MILEQIAQQGHFLFRWITRGGQTKRKADTLAGVSADFGHEALGEFSGCFNVSRIVQQDERLQRRGCPFPLHRACFAIRCVKGLQGRGRGGSFPKRGNYDYVKEKVAVTFYDPKHATKDLVDECFDIVNDKGKTVRTISLAKSAIRHNMASEIPNMNAPTCLIWGQNDTVTPPDVAEEFHELFPDSDLFWIDKCGHAAMMEHPDQFNKILKDWLDKRFPSAA